MMNMRYLFASFVSLAISAAALLAQNGNDAEQAAEDWAKYGSPELMQNVYGRDYELLNGKWDAIIDLYDQGRGKQLWLNRKPETKTEFFEYSFDGGLRLNVPGDFNSQIPQLQYYEGTVWYARHFNASPAKSGDRLYLYFGAVSYRCTVWLNGRELASHEGGFTPFQIDVTDSILDGDNFICIEVNNRRSPEAIPAMSFDWWNYGGITRDVMLVRTPELYIKDYFVQLDKNAADVINASVRMSAAVPAGSEVVIDIPELKYSGKVALDADGRGSASFKLRKLQRWSPDSPKLYDVRLSYIDGNSGAGDSISEKIGFRNISVDGTRILVNGKPTFMRSVSFHEEIPQRMGRAFSEADAWQLLSEAKDLGVNMVRLAHYPQNEYTVRLAERLGIILWQEIPVWQGIDFENSATMDKALRMFSEMLYRDKNRCAVGFWGVANETRPSQARNAFLHRTLEFARGIDSTRLYTAAFDNVYYKPEFGEFRIEDDFTRELDVVSFNKYMGWYAPWPAAPSECRWNVVPDKPVIISEFGCEALYGQRGNAEWAGSWSEDYQAENFLKNLEMFEQIPNLAGVSPWVLYDFRSPFRFHPTNQDGWNRKGLVSDQGQRKKAWYVIHNFYLEKKKEYQNIKK